MAMSASLGSHAGVFEVEVFRSGTEGYNVFRIPTIVSAANGDLLAFAEARSGGDASEIDVVMKRSVDKGETWGALQVVQDNADFEKYFSPDDRPPITVGNQTPVIDLVDPAHPGRIWMPFTLENDRAYVTYSDDHGETWAPHREITSAVKQPNWGWYATGPVHGIQLERGEHTGRLVIPAYFGVQGQSGSEANVVYSDDHGQTWQLGAISSSMSPQANPGENTVVELVDGRLYFNGRDPHSANPGSRSYAYSSDGGLSFDAPGFVHDQRISTPLVQNAVLRFHAVDQGDADNIILYSHPGQATERRDMTIRVSLDETESWAYSKVIREGAAAYSDLVKIDDNRFGVLFETGQQLYEQIIFSYMDYETVTLGAWNGVEGDVNQDGVFDVQDVEAFAAAWDPLSKERFLGAQDSYLNGDLNFDGDNNLQDVFALRQLLIAEGISAAALEAVFAIPEPQSWCLMVLLALPKSLRVMP
jgi:sialidase-1